MNASMRITMALAIAAATLTLPTISARAQQASPSDLSANLSGTWVLNRQLSTGFKSPPAGRRGGGGSPLFAIAPLAGQRGSRGGGGAGGGISNESDLTPEQRAEQAAMRQLEQISDRIVITASGDTITFADSRGERTFQINGKSVKIDVAGSQISVKSKWDKNVVRQEFSNSQAKLVETWGIDDAAHLVLTAKLESMTLQTPEQKAVFDRQ